MSVIFFINIKTLANVNSSKVTKWQQWNLKS